MKTKREFEQFDKTKLSPYFNVDDIRKIRDFHGEMYINHGEDYLQYMNEEFKKTSDKVKSDIEKIRNRKAKERTENNIINKLFLFADEVVKAVIAMPDYLQRECDGDVTSIKIIKIMLRDTSDSLGNAPYKIAECIKEFLGLDISFERIAEALSSSSDAKVLEEFYNKYRHENTN